MTVNDYLRVLRKRWRVLAVFVLLGIGMSAGLVWHTTPKYEASTQLFVAANDTSDLTALAQGNQFTQSRVQSYAEIINSAQITAPVATKYGDGLTADEVSDEVSASAPLNTVLVNVHVSDDSASRAETLANAISDKFVKYASKLETTAGASSSPVKVTVVKRATLPTGPVSPKPIVDILIGLVIGLGLGLVAALYRESSDNTVRTSADIQDIVGIGTLGVIGFDTDAKSHPLVVAQGGHSPRSEAFRALRTNLQFVNVDEAPRSIVLTSSVPDEGKTTTACNLAIALAQGGKRVLLIEADLRRPRAAKYLGLTDTVGVTNVLVGTVSPEDASQQWGNIPLYVLPSGPTPPNPSELLASKGMGALLARVEATYDIVLLDAPPLLPVTDAAVIAAQASGAVLIVRSGKTTRDQLKRSVEALESVNASLLGAVINMAPTKGPDAYHYDYSYTYTDRPKNEPAAETPGRRRNTSSPGPATVLPHGTTIEPSPASERPPASTTAVGHPTTPTTPSPPLVPARTPSAHQPASVAPRPAATPFASTNSPSRVNPRQPSPAAHPSPASFVKPVPTPPQEPETATRTNGQHDPTQDSTTNQPTSYFGPG